MIHRLKLLLASVALVVGFSGVALPVTGFAYSQSHLAACQGLTQINGDDDCSHNGKGLTDTVKVAVDVLSYFVGIVAVVMIIVGGFRYITSGGDSGRVSSAKNTLVYALVGLFIAAIAQVLVKFVLFQSTK